MTKRSHSFGAMAFIDQMPPALAAGGYEVFVVQSLSDPSSQTTLADFAAQQTLVVNGPRFSLPAGTVVSCFPPANATGQFGDALPHVVLRHPRLPWQRAACETNDVITPWLAVLTVDPTNPNEASLVTSGTVNDLLNPPSGTLAYATLASLMPGESPTDDCLYVDLPLGKGGVLPALLPGLTLNTTLGLNDVQVLTHVRQLDQSMTELFDIPLGVGAERDFSVVVSNRLVGGVASSTVVAMLVSIEGLESLATEAADSSATAIRLPVLSRWSFVNDGAATDFGALMSTVEYGPIGPVIPFIVPVEAEAGDGVTDPANHVVDALSLGYTALAHQTRDGAATVSWYRGPLLPYGNPPEGGPPYPAADAALAYDPSTGMFDTSLAAAWQLGQLLAMNDPGFAAALYAYKNSLSTITFAAATDAAPDSASLMEEHAAPVLAAALGRIGA